MYLTNIFLKILGFGKANSRDAEMMRNIRRSKSETPSMRVVGRGALTMDASEARNTKKAKEFIKKLDSINFKN